MALSRSHSSTPSHGTGASQIAGAVLPIRRAEELLSTLPGVIAARIIANDTGTVDEIHILTSADVAPKQTVRNIESALIAHLGMRVDHRKISVATTEAPRGRVSGGMTAIPEEPPAPPAVIDMFGAKRSVYFEDVEVRRSRARGVACRVTLRKGEELFVGEAEGVENERSRMELAARATIVALMKSDKEGRTLAVDGAK